MNVDAFIHIFGGMWMAVLGWLTGRNIVRIRRSKRSLRAFREENRLFVEGWRRIGNARSRDEQYRLLLELAEAIEERRQRMRTG